MWYYWVIGYMALSLAGLIWLLAASRKAPSDIDLYGRPIEEIEAQIAGDTQSLAQIHALRERMTELAPFLPDDPAVGAYAYEQPVVSEEETVALE